MNLLKRMLGSLVLSPYKLSSTVNALPTKEKEAFYDSYLSKLSARELAHLKFLISCYQIRLAKKRNKSHDAQANDS